MLVNCILFIEEGGTLFLRVSDGANKQKPAAGAAAMPFQVVFPEDIHINSSRRKRGDTSASRF